MAKSFVTMKRDYVAFMSKLNATTAVRHPADAFEHYNDQCHHGALQYRSPCEIRRRTDSSTRV
ncbi:isrso10-transposase orfb protein [Burkholderia pseudomallei MSHR1043]|uniref:Isrso10-transposase orfb protein n=1 Tax=Burkholderia pseudomallei 1710a TaxID=320371 RepID=A0A0E1W1T0_BURPE|nr:isrso10-transposase orfb protein [Burkholderia pseudomallei MSHR346]EEC35174.1 isrso10-transposase orfb protein [Burkholderia pseudomallei 576]EET06354.1 isrso10-transposase orfb protein [Burkholderia pseudomallei 1710a]EMP77277.1 isrso10-transposase orfb protein [Burkholderia pseudomallei MSHR1043]